MKLLLKFFSSFIYAIIPSDKRQSAKKRFALAKEALTSDKYLRFFWKLLGIVLSPVFLAVSLIVALLKVLFILFSPKDFYGHCKYLLKMFRSDVIERHMSLRVAVKRTFLAIELFVKGKEKRMSYGSANSDKTFYVIRPYYYLVRNELATSLSDLFFHYYRNLQQLSYCVNNGWIPVVDWENYVPLRHMEDYPVNGTVNGWEYFWKQPSEYTLEEVYKSKNVVLANRNSIDYGYIPTPFLTPPFAKYAKRLSAECPQYDKLFVFNDVTKAHIEEWQEKLFPHDARILGVSVRGSAYGVHPVHGHPKQPAIEKVISIVKENFESQKMDYIFFACEAEFFVEQMQAEFGDRLIVLPRERIKTEPKEGEGNPLYRPGQRYQTNLDYLTEMALLSRCTSIIAGMSSGTRVAIIWNANRFEKTVIFDNGLW